MYLEGLSILTTARSPVAGRLAARELWSVSKAALLALAPTSAGEYQRFEPYTSTDVFVSVLFAFLLFSMGRLDYDHPTVGYHTQDV